MSTLARVAVLIGMMAAAPGPVAGQERALWFKAALTERGVVERAVIYVDGDRIVRIESGTPKAGVPTTDLRSLTAIPGLIDLHVHATYFWDEKPGTRPWQQLGQRPAPTLLVLAQNNLRRALESGVTTMRDLHSRDRMAVLLRDLIDSGYVTGPRIVAAGCGLGMRPGRTSCGSVGHDSASIVKAVNDQLDGGADLIKIFASTGSADDLSGSPTFSAAELRWAIEAAHARGKPVTVHSYGPIAARDAVLAGAESVEHPVDLDDETLAEMARRGTVYVSTIDHNRYYADHREEFGYTEENDRALREFVARNLETARRAHAAGVRIGMGSDAVFTGFGENTRELEWFVRAGMTPAEALATATTTPAELLGRGRDLGRLAPGYLADIAAVAGDPLADIGAVVHGVRWVMKSGQVVVDRTH
ncbi:MAG: amidohydrolase family protein [Gemmatimonadales bacterium]